MPSKKSTASQSGTAAVLDLRGDPTRALARLKQASDSLSKAHIRASWILAAQDASPFLRHPLVRRLKPLFVRPGISGDWPAFRAAALASKAKWLLLLPAPAAVSPAVLRGLASQASRFDWICSRRGSHPGWLESLLSLGWRAPALDLGSPSLVKREILAGLARHYDASAPLLGQRLFGAAAAGGLEIGELPSDEEGRLSPLSSLGLDPELWKGWALKSGEGALTSAFFAAVGSMAYTRFPTIGLALLSLGLIGLFSFMARPE